MDLHLTWKRLESWQKKQQQRKQLQASRLGKAQQKEEKTTIFSQVQL